MSAESERRDLYNRLEEVLGTGPATKLMEHLPTATTTELMTGNDFRREMDRLRSEMTARFDQIDARFEQMDARFDQMDARFEQIDARFEQVDARFNQNDARFGQTDSRLDRIEAGLAEVHKRIDRVMLAVLGGVFVVVAAIFGTGMAG